MANLNLKPNSAAVKKYYATLERFARGHFDKEGNIRGAFEDLLKHCARQFDWTLVPEYSIPRKDRNPLSIDGALLDAFRLHRGYWEAKDEKDTLEAEMKKKFEAGYPRSNILFQRPTRALLFQDGRIAFNHSIEDPQKLVDVLRLFFEWRQPDHDTWDRAVAEFSARVPEIAQGAMELIESEKKTNRAFVSAFGAFADLCRESINPDLKDEAVEEMLVQHLLTERIFRRIFDNPEFTRRNVIAAEIEKVIDSLTKRHFSRDAFLRDLDPFYKAIEEAASTAENYAAKQAFLNTVYERFFQGFNRKQADTHGIVYTPQPIVDFMVRSVEEILNTEFGRSLSDKDVHILDPFVGTGNFITRVMQEIKTSRLPQKYKEELHCNEVMLLPYYIASMNIEHAYLDRVGEYEPFEGICLVDTFELAEPEQGTLAFMTEENTARVRRQKKSPIFVVLGNPPYNIGQEDENDRNRNRKYPEIDARISKTFVKDSRATLTNSLFDPYIRAYRWAMDRIGREGIIAFVTNSGFIDGLASDGVRKHLAANFDSIYVLDLGGNVRKNPRLSGSTHNVFGIQVGVSINILVRRKAEIQRSARVHLWGAEQFWTRYQKYRFLDERHSISAVSWRECRTNSRGDWLKVGDGDDFHSFIPMGSKESKHGDEPSIFSTYCNGQKSNSDEYIYSFSHSGLTKRAQSMVENYSAELDRWKRAHCPEPVEDFIRVDVARLKWIRHTKRCLARAQETSFGEADIRNAMYRPFVGCYSYLNPVFNEDLYQLPTFFPPGGANCIIAVNMTAERPFTCVATTSIPNLVAAGGFGCTTQAFPASVFDEDGTNRRDNITDWALAEFRSHYGQKSITKLDIFHYVYGLLHHPEYRTRYAANLKRELPRIPFAPEFKAYARIGAALMRLHIEYEQQPEYPLERTETGKLDWRVEKMTLSKDKSQLKYNGFLTLSGIPPEVYEYRLGNRSALEWVVDQYQVTTDKRSGIVNDPNRDDDPEYIVRLIGQVVTVSIETVKLVKELAALALLPVGKNTSAGIPGTEAVTEAPA